MSDEITRERYDRARQALMLATTDRDFHKAEFGWSPIYADAEKAVALVEELDRLRAELTAARTVEDGEVAKGIDYLHGIDPRPENYDVKLANLLTRLSAARAEAERERDEARAALAQAREGLTGLELKFAERAEGQRQWINENAPYISHDQKHLDADTVERAYWHYGYCIALGDVAGQIKTTLAALTPTQESETP